MDELASEPEAPACHASDRQRHRRRGSIDIIGGTRISPPSHPTGEERPINVPEHRPDGSPPDVLFRPVPVTQHVVEPRWWEVWKRPTHRDFSEEYRPPRWWQRLFSLISLSVISITAGVMAAVAIAAAVAAVAIALQSLVS